jgi:hypothetical protein
VCNDQDQEPLSRELQLAHLSVRDFFWSRLRFAAAQFLSMQSTPCLLTKDLQKLAYLRQFDKPLALPANPPESYYLARYAAKHWLHHVQAVVRAAERLLPIPTDRLSRLSNIGTSTPLIALIVDLLLQILKVLSLSSTSAQVKNLSTDLKTIYALSFSALKMLSCITKFVYTIPIHHGSNSQTLREP